MHSMLFQNFGAFLGLRNLYWAIIIIVVIVIIAIAYRARGRNA
jgi:hypothetical protein